MKVSKKILVVVYFMLPLFVISAFLPLMMEMQAVETMNEYEQTRLLHPRVIQRKMGLMTPVSSSDAIWEDYSAVDSTCATIGTAYLGVTCKTGSSATISNFKSLLGQVDRMHVAAHGSMAQGPTVELYGDSLYRSQVLTWTAQGDRCKLVFLSACNSLGDSGNLNSQLASAIISKSGVSQIVGYKDEVDAGGAAIFAGLFWSYHLWANGLSGGESSDDAISDAKDDIHALVSDAAIQALIGSLITSAVISIICGVIALLVPEFPWLVGILLSILVSLFSVVQMILFMISLNSAYYNIAEYGSSVAGLTYSGGGGGGGGDLPF